MAWGNITIQETVERLKDCIAYKKTYTWYEIAPWIMHLGGYDNMSELCENYQELSDIYYHASRFEIDSGSPEDWQEIERLVQVLDEKVNIS